VEGDLPLMVERSCLIAADRGSTGLRLKFDYSLYFLYVDNGFLVCVRDFPAAACLVKR